MKVIEFLDKYLTNVLLMGFSLIWLIVFLDMRGMAFYSLTEPNPVILDAEISLCGFAFMWSIYKVVRKLRFDKERKGTLTAEELTQLQSYRQPTGKQ